MEVKVSIASSLRATTSPISVLGVPAITLEPIQHEEIQDNERQPQLRNQYSELSAACTK